MEFRNQALNMRAMTDKIKDIHRCEPYHISNSVIVIRNQCISRKLLFGIKFRDVILPSGLPFYGNLWANQFWVVNDSISN